MQSEVDRDATKEQSPDNQRDLDPEWDSTEDDDELAFETATSDSSLPVPPQRKVKKDPEDDLDGDVVHRQLELESSLSFRRWALVGFEFSQWGSNHFYDGGSKNFLDHFYNFLLFL